MTFGTIDIKEIAGLQAITLPKDVRIDDDKVYVKKMGNVIYLIPFHNPWQSLIDSLHEFTEDYMDERNQPKHQKREHFD